LEVSWCFYKANPMFAHCHAAKLDSTMEYAWPTFLT
jgi:hypothetical protein